MVVLLLFSVILTLCLPIISIPLNFIGMIITDGKIRKCYGTLFALSLAIMAFIWVPNESSDLYRYHQQMQVMKGQDLGFYLSSAKEAFEPAHHLIKYAVAQTGNYALLQFLGVLLCFFGMTWLACDYAETKKMKKTSFVLSLVYMLVANGFMYYASAIWCYLAIICIAIGLYLNFFKRKKYLQYVFFALAACLHIGTLYVVIFAILFSNMKIFREVKLPLMVTVSIFTLLFSTIIQTIGNMLGSETAIGAVILDMYDEYFINSDKFNNLHEGWNLYLPLFNSIVGLVVGLMQSKNKSLSEYSSVIVYLSIFTIVTMLTAGVFLRFGLLVVIAASPLLIETFETLNKKHLLLAFYAVIIILSCMQAYRSCAKMEESGLAKRIGDNLTSGIGIIFKES